jgi:5,10-methenyltetrahydrofolate synthetase
MQSKDQLREFWQDQLESVSYKKFLAAQLALSQQLGNFLEQKYAALKVVAAFRAQTQRGEAGLEQLLAQASKFAWAFPIALPSGELDFRSAAVPLQAKDFLRSKWGIWEPLGSAPVVTPQLILVPLLAFDRQGTRLGRGKGFYDRLLAKWPQLPAIGIAFSWQQSNESLPCEAHDKKLSLVVTEKEILEF